MCGIDSPSDDKLNSTYLFIMYKFAKVHVGNKILFFGEPEQKLTQEVKKYAKDKESVLAIGTTPHIYYLSNTLPSIKPWT